MNKIILNILSISFLISQSFNASDISTNADGAKDVFGVIAGHLPQYHTSASLSEDNITGSLFLELSGSLINSDREPYLKNGWTMKPSFTAYAKTYPTAFIKYGNLRIEFKKAKINKKTINASASIKIKYGSYYIWSWSIINLYIIVYTVFYISTLIRI